MIAVSCVSPGRRYFSAMSFTCFSTSPRSRASALRSSFSPLAALSALKASSGNLASITSRMSESGSDTRQSGLVLLLKDPWKA